MAISVKTSESGVVGVVEDMCDAWKNNLFKMCQLIVPQKTKLVESRYLGGRWDMDGLVKIPFC